jgi:transcriptional regulator with XRE-family HTH domain
MITREELLKSPEYWITEVQMELYRSVLAYMEKEGLNQTQLAEQLGVSKGYVSQVLNGNFNYTLRKLIELSLAVGKVPMIEFKDISSVIADDHNKRTSQEQSSRQNVQDNFTRPTCHKLFETFCKDISLIKKDEARIESFRNNIRGYIRDYFKKNHPEYVPKFMAQGSFQIDTTIKAYNDTCTIDDGVYFFREPDVSSNTLQEWLLAAVSRYKGAVLEHHKKYVRVIGQEKGYQINVSIYCKGDRAEFPFLAIQGEGWRESDPRGFSKWFNQHKDNNGQLNRIIKYLKAWRNYEEKQFEIKMPSDLCIIILTCNNIAFDENDDLALNQTLEKIQMSLDDERFKSAVWECKMPTRPYNNLFDKYDPLQKQSFLEGLNSFCQDSQEAIKEKSERRASLIWQKHLGQHFPLREDKEESDSKIQSMVV